MVNTESIDSPGDGKANDCITQLSSASTDSHSPSPVTASILCLREMDFANETADITTTECGSPMDSPPETAVTGEEESSSLTTETENVEVSSLYCSVPLNKVRDVLNSYTFGSNNRTCESNNSNNSETKKKLTRKLLCLYCDRTFVTTNLKQKHVDRCHSVKQARRSSSRFQQAQSTTACIFCNKLNNTDHSLKELFTHLVDEHSNKYFACANCEERFLFKSHLEEHDLEMHDIRSSEILSMSDDNAKDCEEERKPKLNGAIFSHDLLLTNSESNESEDKEKTKTIKSKHKTKIKDEIPSEKTKIVSGMPNLRMGVRKELRKKKVGVKSTKVGVKRNTRLQAKIMQAKPVKKRTKNKVGEKNVPKAEPAEKISGCINPYPTFDAFFRVKKITDHSIDNLKISSLTFDDVFDKAFYNRIKCNIQENLQNHIDGKLFKNEESESRISNFEKMREVNSSPTENFGCDLTLNAATPVVSLLSTQFGEDLESQIEYASKASKKKPTPKTDEVHYKYFTRRKYQASILESKENRDLSKLDMWTQLIVKNRQQKIINDKKTEKEKLEYTKGVEYRTKMKNEELNRILDRRGPFEDLKEEANKKAALEKLHRLGANVNCEAISDVACILNDILNSVFAKDNEALEEKIEVVEEKTPDATRILLETDRNCEIPFYLELRQSSSLACEPDVDRSDRITLICSSQETDDFEVSSVPRDKKTLVGLTGEWTRSRIYICAACGVKVCNMKLLIDHKSVFHQNVWVQHYEFVGNQSELYRHLSIPGLGKVGCVEGFPMSKVWKRSDARFCTKCSKTCNSLGELHRHVLECGEDWSWMLARKKLKYRPFGAKSRRKRRGLVKRILHKEKSGDAVREKKKYNIKRIEGPRPKPSDAETIQRMLANLPAKRASRKIISLKDGFPRQRRKRQTGKNLPQNQIQSKANKLINKNKKSLQQSIKNSREIIKVATTKKGIKCNPVILRKSVRNINKVFGSKLLDTNSTLLVKRKIKTVLQHHRITRSKRQMVMVNAEVEKNNKSEQRGLKASGKQSFLSKVKNLQKAVTRNVLKSKKVGNFESAKCKEDTESVNKKLPPIRKTRSAQNLAMKNSADSVICNITPRKGNEADDNDEECVDVEAPDDLELSKKQPKITSFKTRIKISECNNPTKKASAININEEKLKKDSLGSKLIRSLSLRRLKKDKSEDRQLKTRSNPDLRSSIKREGENGKIKIKNGKRKSALDSVKKAIKKMKLRDKTITNIVQVDGSSQICDEIPKILPFLENIHLSEDHDNNVEDHVSLAKNFLGRKMKEEILNVKGVEEKNCFILNGKVDCSAEKAVDELLPKDSSVADSKELTDKPDTQEEKVIGSNLGGEIENAVKSIKASQATGSSNVETSLSGLENCNNNHLSSVNREKGEVISSNNGTGVNKPKPKKRVKGLNDCIAMLTSKLRQKVETKIDGLQEISDVLAEETATYDAESASSFVFGQRFLNGQNLGTKTDFSEIKQGATNRFFNGCNFGNKSDFAEFEPTERFLGGPNLGSKPDFSEVHPVSVSSFLAVENLGSKTESAEVAPIVSNNFKDKDRRYELPNGLYETAADNLEITDKSRESERSVLCDILSEYSKNVVEMNPFGATLESTPYDNGENCFRSISKLTDLIAAEQPNLKHDCVKRSFPSHFNDRVAETVKRDETLISLLSNVDKLQDANIMNKFKEVDVNIEIDIMKCLDKVSESNANSNKQSDIKKGAQKKAKTKANVKIGSIRKFSNKRKENINVIPHNIEHIMNTIETVVNQSISEINTPFVASEEICFGGQEVHNERTGQTKILKPKRKIGRRRKVPIVSQETAKTSYDPDVQSTLVLKINHVLADDLANVDNQITDGISDSSMSLQDQKTVKKRGRKKKQLQPDSNKLKESEEEVKSALVEEHEPDVMENKPLVELMPNVWNEELLTSASNGRLSENTCDSRAKTVEEDFTVPAAVFESSVILTPKKGETDSEDEVPLAALIKNVDNLPDKIETKQDFLAPNNFESPEQSINKENPAKVILKVSKKPMKSIQRRKKSLVENKIKIKKRILQVENSEVLNPNDLLQNEDADLENDIIVKRKLKISTAIFRRKNKNVLSLHEKGRRIMQNKQKRNGKRLYVKRKRSKKVLQMENKETAENNEVETKVKQENKETAESGEEKITIKLEICNEEEVMQPDNEEVAKNFEAEANNKVSSSSDQFDNDVAAGKYTNSSERSEPIIRQNEETLIEDLEMIIRRNIMMSNERLRLERMQKMYANEDKTEDILGGSKVQINSKDFQISELVEKRTTQAEIRKEEIEVSEEVEINERVEIDGIAKDIAIHKDVEISKEIGVHKEVETDKEVEVNNTVSELSSKLVEINKEQIYRKIKKCSQKSQNKRENVKRKNVNVVKKASNEKEIRSDEIPFETDIYPEIEQIVIGKTKRRQKKKQKENVELRIKSAEDDEIVRNGIENEDEKSPKDNFVVNNIAKYTPVSIIKNVDAFLMLESEEDKNGESQQSTDEDNSEESGQKADDKEDDVEVNAIEAIGDECEMDLEEEGFQTKNLKINNAEETDSCSNGNFGIRNRIAHTISESSGQENKSIQIRDLDETGIQGKGNDVILLTHLSVKISTESDKIRKIEEILDNHLQFQIEDEYLLAKTYDEEAERNKDTNFFEKDVIAETHLTEKEENEIREGSMKEFEDATNTNLLLEKEINLPETTEKEMKVPDITEKELKLPEIKIPKRRAVPNRRGTPKKRGRKPKHSLNPLHAEVAYKFQVENVTANLPAPNMVGKKKIVEPSITPDLDATDDAVTEYSAERSSETTSTKDTIITIHESTNVTPTSELGSQNDISICDTSCTKTASDVSCNKTDMSALFDDTKDTFNSFNSSSQIPNKNQVARKGRRGRKPRNMTVVIDSVSSAETIYNTSSEPADSNTNTFTSATQGYNKAFDLQNDAFIQTPDLNDAMIADKLKAQFKVKVGTKKAKRGAKSEVIDNPEELYCDICEKMFVKIENLVKHKRTLTHISKLSEIEAREAAAKARAETNKETQNTDAYKMNINISDILNNSEKDSERDMNNEIANKMHVNSPFMLNTNSDTLKLADIINDVLNKPVENDSLKHNYAESVIIKEPKRYKSLGERKSFESDLNTAYPFNNLQMSDDLPLPKLTNNADSILKHQISISILENIIENQGPFGYIDDITISSNKSIEEQLSRNSPSELSVMSDSKQYDSNQITFSHNTNIMNSLIKPLHEDNFVKPTQYEEISNDSSTVRNHFDDQRARKVLNRDEELFLECCSLLKSSSEVSSYSKRSSKNVLNNFEMKPSDEPDWLERKSFSGKNQEFRSGGFSDSCPNTPLGDGFGDEYSNTNSNTIATDWNSKQKEQQRLVENPVFEDISADVKETSLCDGRNNDDIVQLNYKANHFNDFKIFGTEKCSAEEIGSTERHESSNNDTVIDGGVKVMDTDLKKKMVSRFGGLMAKALKNSLQAVKKSKQFKKKQCLENTQTSITDYVVPLGQIKAELNELNDNKKMLTKGAMKVFEGLKVSIPTDDLDIKELLHGTFAAKKVVQEPKEDPKPKVVDKIEPAEAPKEDSKSITKTNLKKFGNKLGLKVTKKKQVTKIRKSPMSKTKKFEEDSKKAHDVYDFEETQDNTDIFSTTNFTNLTAFRNQIIEKKTAVEVAETKACDLETENNAESDSDGNNRLLDTFSFEAQSVSSFSTESSSSVKMPKQKNITKKKCMIMGRIFKNAFKSKVEDDIRDLPVVDNSKLVEDYVMQLPQDNTADKVNKMSEHEMDVLFDKLLQERIGQDALLREDSKDSKATETKQKPDPKTVIKPKAKVMTKRKRQRHNSESTDDEFSINTIRKRNTKKKAKNVDDGINLEQELKECIGVASRKSQRKCTSGKQNVLVEFWSSDDSNFETLFYNDPPPSKPQELSEPPPNNEVEKVDSIEPEKEPPALDEVPTEKQLEAVAEPESDTENQKIPKPEKAASVKQVRRKSAAKHSRSKNDEDREDKKLKNIKVTAETLAANRRKRAAADTLYYWSSSSEDESQDLIEVKPIRDEVEEDDDRPIHHGWIVGDSPKKLVTMLAQAKGKKVDAESVKEQSKKRTTM